MWLRLVQILLLVKQAQKLSIVMVTSERCFPPAAYLSRVEVVQVNRLRLVMRAEEAGLML